MNKDQQKRIFKLFDLLQQSRLTIGFAESCTGGLLSSWVTQFSGVSSFYIGSIISYSNAVKQEVLKVSKTTLETEGAVSAATVKEMLAGVRNLLRVDCAAAITGIAGPTGGSMEKPIGLVFVSVCGPGFEYTESLRLKGDRTSIQSQACARVIEMLIEGLESGELQTAGLHAEKTKKSEK